MNHKKISLLGILLTGYHDRYALSNNFLYIKLKQIKSFIYILHIYIYIYIYIITNNFVTTPLDKNFFKKVKYFPEYY